MTRKVIIIGSLASSLINFRLNLMLDFKRCGFDVIAMAPYDANVEAKLAEHNIRFIAFNIARNGLNPFHDGKTLVRLYQFLKQEGADIIFTYTIKPVIYGGIAAKLAKIPYRFAMLTGTGYAFSKNGFKNKLVGLIAKKLLHCSLKYYNKLFFQNKDNLIFFREEKLISKFQPHVIVNGSGVDVDYFSPAALPSDLSFIMIARLLHDKGVREYVMAAHQLKKIYPHVNFKLAGWVDTNPNSIKQAELDKWITDGCIDYLGKLTDVREAIAASSVYVLPSYGEGTPRTVLEAMAMQRPIITTDVPGCRETVVQDENGFLVPVRDITELVKAMIYFLENPQEVARMGLASRKLAEIKYDVSKVNQHMLSEMEIIGASSSLSAA